MPDQNAPCIEYEFHESIAVVIILEERIREPERVNQIKESMTDAVSNRQCKNLIIDMSRIQFIGSIGFLAFLAMRRVPGIENVILCNMAENVKELFLICRLIPSATILSAPFHEAKSVPSALEWCLALAD